MTGCPCTLYNANNKILIYRATREKWYLGHHNGGWETENIVYNVENIHCTWWRHVSWCIEQWLFFLSSMTLTLQYTTYTSSDCFLSSMTLTLQYTTCTSSDCFLLSSMTLTHQYTNYTSSDYFLLSSMTLTHLYTTYTSRDCFLLSSMALTLQYTTYTCRDCFLLSSMTLTHQYTTYTSRDCFSYDLDPPIHNLHEQGLFFVWPWASNTQLTPAGIVFSWLGSSVGPALWVCLSVSLCGLHSLDTDIAAKHFRIIIYFR